MNMNEYKLKIFVSSWKWLCCRVLEVPTKWEEREEPQTTACRILEDLNPKLHHSENLRSK